MVYPPRKPGDSFIFLSETLTVKFFAIIIDNKVSFSFTPGPIENTLVINREYKGFTRMSESQFIFNDLTPSL